MIEFFIALYFLPVLIAVVNHHPRLAGIAVLDLMLGWTLMGWVLALAWAMYQPHDEVWITIRNL
jgi:hypothetical protein